MGSKNAVSLSVIIPISERHDDLRKIYLQYVESLGASNYSYEFIFVLDGANLAALEILKALRSEFPSIKVLTTNRRVGETTALAIGFEQAKGSTILTLSPYLQVETGRNSACASGIRRGQIRLGDNAPRAAD